MRNFKDHLIPSGCTIKQALVQLDILAKDAILFLVDENEKLMGSVTDGDVRRGLIRGVGIDDQVDHIAQPKPRFIRKGDFDIATVINYRENNFKIIPVLDKENRVLNIINFREIKSCLPVDAVIMAGGRGERLRPLTDTTPKPMLKLGDKPLIEHNLARLIMYGIDDIWISVKYLGDQIQSYFGNGKERNINIRYIWEDEPLGTMGSISKVSDFEHDYILVINSDLLTNFDYEQFFLDFLRQEADLAVASIPYQVIVPFAVLETSETRVTSFKEKPTYTYYSNGGIYLMKHEVAKLIPKFIPFNATDLMDILIRNGFKVISYPFSGYWLDIGNPEDLEKAKRDIVNLH